MTTTTVYFEDDNEGPALIGRALTQEEYKNLTAQELLNTILNSSACYRVFDWKPQNAYEERLERDSRTPERVYKDLTVQELKNLLKKDDYLLIRSQEPQLRTVPPRFSKGPNKGEYNYFNKNEEAWEEIWDRWYTIEEKDNVIAVEAEVVIQPDGGWSLVNPAEAKTKAKTEAELHNWLSGLPAEGKAKVGKLLIKTLKNQMLRRSSSPTLLGPMTTFWLSFSDPDASSDKRFLGVAIFDMDESGGPLTVLEIVRRAHKLGINPGGQVSVQEVEAIPDEYKNQLITDDALLLKLGSRGRSIKH
jgi:hypothetical protein